MRMTPKGTGPAIQHRGAAERDGGDAQDEVVAFLANAASWQPPPPDVAHIETHGAHVFLAGDRVLKIKRAANFGYMDFSTLEQRRAVVEREVEINRRFAPGIYLGMVAITREPDGGLAIGGAGPPVEWAVAMRRFNEDDVLASVARRGALAPGLVKALAETVLAAHRAAPVRLRNDGAAIVGRLIGAIAGQLAEAGDAEIGRQAAQLGALLSARLGHAAGILDARGRRGCIRRCHGDLHLGNIVLIDGRPTLFDALEFDEELATIDTLYDLAFLIMDLDASGHRPEANLLLAQYLWLSGEENELAGLAALPMFLALRAAIRALVGLQRQAVAHDTHRMGAGLGAAGYLARALDYAQPPPPRLVAIGGLSGTGKSTLAALLAARFGAVPGALHLRSDLERKALAGARELERLPAEAYTQAATAAVYARLMSQAGIALEAGHSVIVDAVFQREAEREAIENVARRLGVPFDGLWLSAPEATMLQRIEGRRGDASDATVDVARAQLAREAGHIRWTRLAAGGTPGAVLSQACRELGIAEPQSLSST